jgi:uridine nucleosidase
MLHELLMFFASTYAHVYGLTRGPPLHDPIAVAAILPDQLNGGLDFDDGEGERWNVRVVTDGLHSNSSDQRGEVGRTVATMVGAKELGVRIPRGVNVDHFWAIVESCIQRAEKALSRSSSAV